MKRFRFLILIFFIVGCSTSYVQKSPDWNPNKPQKTLLAHYEVKEKGPIEVGLLDVVKAVVSDENPFQKLGLLTVVPFKIGAKKRNIDLYVDSSRSKKLNEMQLIDLEKTAGKKASNLMQLGSGVWIHPETGNLAFSKRSTILGDFYKDIVKTLDVKGDDLAMSAEVSVKKGEVFLGFGKKVELNLITRIINSSGKPVYESYTYGESSTVWFSSEWLNEETIVEAISNAVNEMVSLEMEEISILKF